MKLFDDFEAVKFPGENMIFITYGWCIYYIYRQKRIFNFSKRSIAFDMAQV